MLGVNPSCCQPTSKLRVLRFAIGKEGYFPILQGLEMRWRGLAAVRRHAHKEVVPKKKYFFVVEKYLEDAKQDENHVPGLLEAIMRPTGLVKEDSRPILSKMNQFGSKIVEIMVSTFWIPEIRSFPVGGQCQPARQ